MNKPTAAAGPLRAAARCRSGAAGETIAVPIPDGHVGPVVLSQTGRTVWWTGRVAIGLRYEPPRGREPQGRSAEWLQNLLLRTAPPDCRSPSRG